jgi:hypothetical protein
VRIDSPAFTFGSIISDTAPSASSVAVLAGRPLRMKLATSLIGCVATRTS